MRTLDNNNVEILDPDLTKGYIMPDRLLIAHHSAISAVPAKMHCEISAQFANGGENWVTVIDAPAVDAKEAWDEYEEIQRYIEYTQEQLDEINKPSEVESLRKEVVSLRTEICELQNQNLRMEKAYINGVNGV